MVFGGTTEGKLVARCLDKKGIRYLYSTRTETSPFFMRCGEYRFGTLDEGQMASLFRAKRVAAVIDAAHPFASILHETVARVSLRLSLPVIRFERNYDLPEESVHSAGVRYAESFPEAVELLRSLSPQRVLAMTGVQTIGMLKPYWIEHEMKVRILPSPRSVLLAREQGFPMGDLILLKPSGNLQEERRLIKAYGIDCILVKESGNSGFLPVKIKAAAACGIRVVVVKRPRLSGSFITVTSEPELSREVETISRVYHAGY